MPGKYKVSKDDLKYLYSIIDIECKGKYHQIYESIGAQYGGKGNKFYCIQPEAHSMGNDRHPSMEVGNDTGMFHCFSCGIGGNFQTFFKEFVAGTDFDKNEGSYTSFMIDLLHLDRFINIDNDPKNAQNKIEMKALYERMNQEYVKVTGKPYEMSEGIEVIDEIPKYIDVKINDGYVDALMANEELQKYLKDTRKITDKQIVEYRIGFNGTCITFPQFTHNGELSNIKGYCPWSKTHSGKWVYPFPGYNTIPSPMINFTHNKVYILEGEPDTYCALSFGINAVTLGHASMTDVGKIFGNDEAKKIFTGKEIVIVMDADEAGQTASTKIASGLYAFTQNIKIVDLNKSDLNPNGLDPASMKDVDGKQKRAEKDFTEFMHKNGFGADALKAFLELEEKTPLYTQAVIAVPDIDISPEEKSVVVDGIEIKANIPWLKTYRKKTNATLAFTVLQDKLLFFMQDSGFAKYYPLDSKNSSFIYDRNKILNICSEEMIIDWMLEYVKRLPKEIAYDTETETALTSDQVLAEFFTHSRKYFDKTKLECIAVKAPTFLKDASDKSYFVYQNCWVEVTDNGYKTFDRKDLPEHIWEKQVIKRNFDDKISDDQPGEYEIFIRNVCSERINNISTLEWIDLPEDEKTVLLQENTKIVDENNNRFEALKTVIGYMCHKYKDRAETKMIVLNDAKISDDPTEANGGGGKSIFENSIGHMRNVEIFDGKMFDIKKSQFTFARISLDTDVVALDDLNKNFRIEDLFSIITSGIEIEKKGQDRVRIPFADSPKWICSTNQTIKVDNESATRRIHEYEFFDHYSNAYSPKDEFGHLLFDDWDDIEWSKFDKFMLSCMAHYLKKGLMKSEQKNLAIRKLINETCPEFVTFADDRFIELIQTQQKQESPSTTSELGLYFTIDIKQGLLFNDFCDQNDYWQKQYRKNEFTQNKFTRWLKKYAQYKGFKIESTKIREGKKTVNSIELRKPYSDF